MRESYTYLPQLPSNVDVPYPYIGLGDLLDVSKRFDSHVTQNDTATLQDEFFRIQQKIVPDEASFIATSASNLSKRLELIALNEVSRKDKHVGVVILDRYIAPHISHPSFFRLNLSRDKTGKQVNRPGIQDSSTEQYQKLHQWRGEQDFDEVILMDDALGVGSTLIQTIRALNGDYPQQKVRAFTGIATSGGEVWSGLEKVYKATGVMTEYLTLQKASEQTESSTGLSICNSRDMTILGGYIQPDTDSLRRSSPHFLPWTVTVPKNFTAPTRRELAADLLFDFNDRFIDFLEKRTQRSLMMRDLTEKGFGVPFTNISIVEQQFPDLKPDMYVKEYLNQAHDVFVRNRPTILWEANGGQKK